MCWAFECCEGDLEDLIWRFSFRELRQKVQLKLGELTATQLCQYNSLVQVVNAALGGGGGSKSGPAPEPDGAFKGSGNIDADVAALNSMLRF